MASSADVLPGGEQPPPRWQAVETLGVSEIVVAVLEARKTRPWATAAYVSREQRDRLVYVRVTLLDDRAPQSANAAADGAGRGEAVAAFTAPRLGEDLILAFGQKDVIILK
jgi:hypothetical protein